MLFCIIVLCLFIFCFREQPEEAMDFLRNSLGQEVLTRLPQIYVYECAYLVCLVPFSKYVTFSFCVWQVAQVPIGTVIHLVRGERPSFTVNKPTRSLDPWDIPDAAADSSNKKNKKDSINGNETEGQTSNQREKQINSSACSKTGLSNTEYCNASSTQHQVEMDEKDQSDGDDEEFWEDEDETEEEDEDADEDSEEDDIQYSVAEMTIDGHRLVVAWGGEGGLGNASIGNDVRLSKGIDKRR